MTHKIVWSFERDHVAASVVCDDDDCLSRYVCDDGEGMCETVYDVRREPDGTVTHAQWDDDFRQIINRHRMVREDYCNEVEFLNADPELIPELVESPVEFVIGETTIEPIWDGDGVVWRPEAVEG